MSSSIIYHSFCYAFWYQLMEKIQVEIEWPVAVKVAQKVPTTTCVKKN